MRRFVSRVSLLMIVCAVLLTLVRLSGKLWDRMQVWVPPGCFQMGSDPAQDSYAQPNEQPQHKVCITHGFWMDQYEVTNGQYTQFVADGGYRNRAYWSEDGWAWVQANQITGPEDYPGYTQEWQPRVGVSWYEAEAYATWRGGRLPTEAEWEYAARGPHNLIYPWGNSWDKRRLNAENIIGYTTTVGSYPGGTSWVGAYDMAGNVWEWVADWNDNAYYQQQIQDDPHGPTSGKYRVTRGGSFSIPQDNARAACRLDLVPEDRVFAFGFRVVTAT